MKIEFPDAGLSERDGVLVCGPDLPLGYRAWLRASDVQKLPDDNSQEWLFISVEPRNYPVLTIQHVQMSEDNLVRHLNNEFEGWRVMKANIGGINYNSDGYI